MSENQTEVVKFLNYLSNPNTLGSDDLVEIKDWVSKYPYSQSLKFIAAKAAQQSSNYQDLLAQAATIAPSRKILHQLINQPENFTSHVLPFSIDDAQTIEERQEAVSNEENLEGVEDKSKLSFGINLNEIYGSEYQTEKIEEESEIENIEEEVQENKEEVSATADAEQIEEVQETEQEFEVENIAKEAPATADEEQLEEVKEVENESSVENIEEEVQENIEEVSTTVDAEQVEEIEEKAPIETIEEEIQDEVQEVENEIPVENLEEEIQIEQVSAIADEEQIEEVEEIVEETSVENIQLEEASTIVDEEQIEEVQEIENESSVENIEEEVQENKEEVSAIADESHIEEVQSADQDLSIENIEEEIQIEEVSAIADEEQVEEEAPLESIDEEVPAIADEEQEEVLEVDEEPEIESIEEDNRAEVPAVVDKEQEKVQEIEEETPVENIEEETQEEVEEPTIENIEEEIVKEEVKKEEPAFQYAPQTDFFALNRKDKVEEKKAEETVEKATNNEESVAAYNDERMPYTFLWWLNKTRKEHANTQPYSSFKLDTSRQIKKQETDGLNHQIAENIFHLRGAEELSSSATNYTVPFDFRKKEFQIIEKFIKEEPQIRPPAANKIDSENKAKKSSEDNNQVVSETLAKIYVEQMLYHKALDVYKKLSLKYPEKSTYFASQIKYLELKVN